MRSESDIRVIDAIPARVLAIGAHPDDVELYAGGTLARWISRGCTVTIVVCTDGRAGCADGRLTASAVANTRRQEQESAARHLGAKTAVMLGYADGGLEDTEQFRGALVELIREQRPEVVLSHDPFTRDRFIHRDHRVTGRVALDAVYPYARDPLHYPDQIAHGRSVHRVDRCLLWDTDQPNAIVDISSTLTVKAAALAKHASQIGGIMGGADPIEWLRKHSREAVAGFDFACGEVFRLMQAPP